MLNQYLVVADNARNTGHVHKLPFKQGKPDILTTDANFSVEQAATVAVLLTEAHREGWNAALRSVTQYCSRVEDNYNVRRR